MARRPSETLFQTACDLCKMPFPSLLRRQEPGLKHSFSCLSMLAFAKMLKQLKLCFEPGSHLR